ncbi:murein biosynthesis integral membrane protein MurJ [Anaerosphaera multitolerans]|uniref:Probable lipid II flippase MurJ n=1 Tax=Anaerosphaera multitolerans TaxID=2487351 RepID=A0A437S441_9FIRM|nr:murein biosynthesis integral membrane protein MurJ [Anaerosphaera multitolerans]RVU53802.1 murein biosynthesis integral membrane protein MurJ [Anaerosphaera multitolerans]
METTKRLAKSTLAIIIFSLIGKIFGLVRESLIAAKFGATFQTDAFYAALGATGIISALVTQSIATTFIPGLQKAESELGHNQKLHFTNNMLSISTIISILVMIMGIALAPALAFLFSPPSKPEAFDLVVELIKLGMPVIVFSAIVGVFTGFLQYSGKFAAAGAVAIPLNLTYILYLTLFTSHAGIHGLTIASVLGVFMQILFLLPSAFKSGYKPQAVLDFKDKYVVESLMLAAPVLISTAVNDINIIVNKRLAMGMAEGSTTILNNANKLNTMILGIFITAITATVFPTMTRTFSEQGMVQGKKVMNASVKSVLFLTVPATVGMIILARPIVDLAFFHGRYTLQNAIDTTATLRFYTIALISMSISNVLNRVYYSLSDTKTPFWVGLINVMINVGLNLLVAHRFGTRGLAASVSIATTIAVLISFVLLRKKIGNLGTKSYIRALIKTLMASAVMGLVAFLYFPIETLLLPFVTSGASIKLIKLIVLLFVVSLAALVYAICLYLLGVREIRDIVKMIKKRLNKN